ncbi:heme peroxidase [Marasmius crinis-equi]|uniref:Peroxidase n=1 Tax=Marasmius crinis-equi TaxID=585013 RepID=A0ABR3ETV6_9AGAR
MSLSFLRAPIRKAAFSPSLARSSLFRASAIRRYSTENPGSTPPPKSSNTALFAGLGVAALGGITYYLVSGSSDPVKTGVQAAKVKANFVPSKEDYQKVYNRIAEIMDEADDYDDGSYGPVLLRLAWHSSGTYDKDTKTGGSNYATMRFEPESLHGANAGLNVAREIMEKVKKEFPWISYGDLWTLGGVAAIQEMGGPNIPWRPGRIDGTAAEATPDGRLPDASQGSDHLRNIFYRMGYVRIYTSRFDFLPTLPSVTTSHPIKGEVVMLSLPLGTYSRAAARKDLDLRACSILSLWTPSLTLRRIHRFNDQEIVALSGAHALGRCHSNRSGYEGPWTFSPTTFTNDFFKLLFDEKWVWKKWNGPKQLEDKSTGSLMMLPTDYVLVQDKSFKKFAKAYADDMELYFKDFSAALARLFELGVPTQQFVSSEPWKMRTVDEQKA